MTTDRYVFSRFLSELAPNVYALYENNRIGKLWGLHHDIDAMADDIRDGSKVWKRRLKQAVGLGREALELFGPFLAVWEKECGLLREHEMGGLANRASKFAAAFDPVRAACDFAESSKTPQEAYAALGKIVRWLDEAWVIYRGLYGEVIEVNSGRASKV